MFQDQLVAHWVSKIMGMFEPGAHQGCAYHTNVVNGFLISVMVLGGASTAI